MINETELEHLALRWFAETGWEVTSGADVAAAVRELNPDLPG